MKQTNPVNIGVPDFIFSASPFFGSFSQLTTNLFKVLYNENEMNMVEYI
jgi:hypothetical protein